MRQSVIRTWLLWLFALAICFGKNNNNTPVFRNFQISEANLSVLPDDGELEGLRKIETNDPVDVGLNLKNVDEPPVKQPIPETDTVLELSGTMSRSCSINPNLADIPSTNQLSQQNVAMEVKPNLDKSENTPRISPIQKQGQQCIQHETTYTGVNRPFSKVPLESDAIRNILGNSVQDEQSANQEVPVFRIHPPSIYKI